jgi:cytochrome c oxidase cbb3-type subunit III
MLRAYLLACLILLQGVAQERTPTRTATTEGQRAAQRRGGAQGTREFLGLGTPPDAEAAKRGEKLYMANCSFCHGAKASGGDTGPDLVRSALVLHDEKGELIGPVIHNGRANKGMPSFPAFTSAELYDLAEFLHMRVELAANRGTYKLLNTVTGDAKAGEAYFRGPGKCASCHSATGDLAHIGSKLSPADLQQTFLYPGAHGYESGHESSAPKVKITLPSGESITGTLKRLDDFNVSFYDTEDQYHSVALSPNIKVEVEDKLAAHRQLLNQYTDTDMHNLTAYLETLK